MIIMISMISISGIVGMDYSIIQIIQHSHVLQLLGINDTILYTFAYIKFGVKEISYF